MNLRKIIIKYFVIAIVVIVGKVEIVNAESYEVSINGVDYICKSSHRISGAGWAKDSFATAEEAKTFCTQQQENYYDNYNIHIFDDPTKCKFEETPTLYDCNCSKTIYSDCQKKDASQTPKYTKPNVAHITFLDENKNVYTTKTCQSSTSNVCDTTAPDYTCSNGVFDGWGLTSLACGGYNLFSPGETLHLSTYSSNAYYSYSPCCYVYSSSNNNNNSNSNSNSSSNNNNNNNFNTNTNNTNNTQDSQSNQNQQDTNLENDQNTTEDNGNTSQDTNQEVTQEIENNTNQETTSKSDTTKKTFVIVLIILIALLVLSLIVVTIIYFHQRKNNNEETE